MTLQAPQTESKKNNSYYSLEKRLT